MDQEAVTYCIDVASFQESDGERCRTELAYALQFSLPGTPVIRYGEEIGIGEDPAQPCRPGRDRGYRWIRLSRSDQG